METTATAPADRALAIKKKKVLDASFFKKGIAIASLSSIMYALYTAFVTGGQLFGVWGNWFGALASTSLVVVFILPTIASGINDTLSAIWATLVTLKQGKIADLGRCIASKHRSHRRGRTGHGARSGFGSSRCPVLGHRGLRGRLCHLHD